MCSANELRAIAIYINIHKKIVNNSWSKQVSSKLSKIDDEIQGRSNPTNLCGRINFIRMAVAARAPLLVFMAAAAAAAAAPMIIGSDMGYLPMEDCYGACPFARKSKGSPPEDALAMQAAAGINTIRLRLWVNPSSHTEPGPWPGPDYSYCNLTSVLAMARRVRGAGMGLWLDFHYSSVWADPGHQTKPAAWAGMDLYALRDVMYNYTYSALQALNEQGTPPSVVQVGNEITNGMLWATGSNCSDGGALYQKGCAAEPGGNWPVLGSLVSSATKAVRLVTPDALLIIHTDLGNKLSSASGVDTINWWYSQLETAGGFTDYDAIGLSYYPQWGAGNTTNVQLLRQVIAAHPNKKIVLCETSYNFQGTPADGPASRRRHSSVAANPPEFPYTPQGQLEYTRAIIAQVRSLGPDSAGGLAWWGGEYYNMASGAGWTSLWDEDGVALPALLQGFQ